MTTQTRKKLAETVISALLTLVATIFVLFGTGAWSSKENAADHNADVRALMELQQRTLDAVCDGQKRNLRACASETVKPVRP